MTPEGRVKAAIKRKLKDAGVWYAMPVSNGMGAHGVPDFLCCVRGRFLAIEAKAAGKRSTATPLQMQQLHAIHAAGGGALIVDDADQLDPVLARLSGAGDSDE